MENAESRNIVFSPLDANDEQGILSLSAFATEIVREHFDPIIGTAQNDYMLAMFQSPSAIRDQVRNGYRYYTVLSDGVRAGFLAFYPRGKEMYLSKFYVHASMRGRHLAGAMLGFVKQAAHKEGLTAITLNVNRDNQDVISIYRHLGFTCIREEKNDIGGGFYMDDLVLSLPL